MSASASSGHADIIKAPADIGDIVPRHWQHDRLLIAVELTLPHFDEDFSEPNNESSP